jgi:hypothetical protein
VNDDRKAGARKNIPNPSSEPQTMESARESFSTRAASSRRPCASAVAYRFVAAIPRKVNTYAELSQRIVPGESEASCADVPNLPTTAESTSESNGVASRIASVGNANLAIVIADGIALFDLSFSTLPSAPSSSMRSARLGLRADCRT